MPCIAVSQGTCELRAHITRFPRQDSQDFPTQGVHEFEGYITPTTYFLLEQHSLQLTMSRQLTVDECLRHCQHFREILQRLDSLSSSEGYDIQQLQDKCREWPPVLLRIMNLLYKLDTREAQQALQALIRQFNRQESILADLLASDLPNQKKDFSKIWAACKEEISRLEEVLQRLKTETRAHKVDVAKVGSP